MTTVDQIRPLLEHAVGGDGLLVEDLTVTPAGKRRVLRVLVDRQLDSDREVTEPVPPLSLDEVSDVTRSISSVLDDSDVMGAQGYTLEVSSPGVSRPLTLPRHFQRNVGRLVTLERAGRDDLTARIVAAGPDDVTVVSGEGGEPERIAYADLGRAVVQVEFARGEKSKES